jgi:hypothetical protein
MTEPEHFLMAIRSLDANNHTANDDDDDGDNDGNDHISETRQ